MGCSSACASAAQQQGLVRGTIRTRKATVGVPRAFTCPVTPVIRAHFRRPATALPFAAMSAAGSHKSRGPETRAEGQRRSARIPKRRRGRGTTGTHEFQNELGVLNPAKRGRGGLLASSLLALLPLCPGAPLALMRIDAAHRIGHSASSVEVDSNKHRSPLPIRSSTSQQLP